jgi:hypothetical protein
VLILLAEQKILSRRFLLKELLEVCIFSCLTLVSNMYDTHGNRRKTQTNIQFTIVAISNASNVAGLNMLEAVAQGKDMINLA